MPAHLADKLSSLLGVYHYPTPIRGQLTTIRTPPPNPTPTTPSQPNHRFHTFQTQETETQCPSSYSGSYYFAIAPDTLATAYNYTNRTTDTTRQPTRAAVVGGFAGRTSGGTAYHEAFSQVDLNRFRTNGGFSAAFIATVFNANNANNLAANTAAGVGPTAEATLDMQALFQTSPTSNNSFIAVTNSQTLLDSLLTIAAMGNSSRPQVVSYSYGFGYSDYDYMTNSGYGPATERALLQLAALGVTVVVSSGDDGTQSAYNRQCSTSPNSLYTGTLIAPVQYASSPMLPQYPASSAYVLSVSETAFLGGPAKTGTGYQNYFSPSVTSPPRCNNCPSGQQYAYFCQSQLSTENPVSTTNAGNVDATTTGGGFSYMFSQPSWQASAVNSYLNTVCASGNHNGCTLPSSSYFNAANRAYPDVSAFGGYLPIQLNGQQTVVSGTSVSAPIVAGLIARLNELSLARTGSPLGFVNALLYQMASQQPDTFNDIAQGNNICPQSNSNCVTAVQGGGGSTSCQGFMSTVGWDPVVGLGSPNIGNMLAYLSARLPSTSSSSSSSSTGAASRSSTATNNNIITYPSLGSTSSPASTTTTSSSSSSSSTSLAQPPHAVASNVSVAASSSSSTAASDASASGLDVGGVSSSGRNGACRWGEWFVGWWLVVDGCVGGRVRGVQWCDVVKFKIVQSAVWKIGHLFFVYQFACSVVSRASVTSSTY